MRTIVIAGLLTLATGLFVRSGMVPAKPKADTLRLYEAEQRQMEMERMTAEVR